MGFWTRLWGQQAAPPTTAQSATVERRDGAAELITALTTALATMLNGQLQVMAAQNRAEIDRLEATKEERKEEKQWRREQREAQRQAAIETNKKRALARAGQNVEGIELELAGCPVCLNSMSMTPYDIDRHYANNHEVYKLRASGSGATRNSSGQAN